MTDPELTVILHELEAAHVSTGYPSDTTFSKGADAIKFLLRERDCLLSDLYFQSHSELSEVPC